MHVQHMLRDTGLSNQVKMWQPTNKQCEDTNQYGEEKMTIYRPKIHLRNASYSDAIHAD